MYTAGAGTLTFAAPERLTSFKKGYNEKVDLWSMGILLIMLITGQHPFSELNNTTANLVN